MRLSLFALPLFALSALALSACNPPIDTEAGTGIQVDEKGCPIDALPEVGSACDKDAVCSYKPGKAECTTNDPGKEIVCADGLWNIYSPIACSAAGALTCDPTGKWHATITGTYEYTPTSAGTFQGNAEFDFEVVKSSDGVLRVGDFDSGDVSPDGCALTVNIGLDYGCSDSGGESSCETWTATLKVDLSKEPVDGTANVTCSGECDIDATAPIKLEKQP